MQRPGFELDGLTSLTKMCMTNSVLVMAVFGTFEYHNGGGDIVLSVCTLCHIFLSAIIVICYVLLHRNISKA